MPMTRQQRWQLKQRQAGNCIICGQPSGGKWRCPACHQKNKDRQTARRREDPAAYREQMRAYFGYKRRYLGAASYHTKL